MKLKTFCKQAELFTVWPVSRLTQGLLPAPSHCSPLALARPHCCLSLQAFAPAPLFTVSGLFPSVFMQNSHASFKTRCVCLHFWEAFCCSELILSILYACLYDETYPPNTAQPSGALRKLCACEGSPGVHGEVWIRQYTWEPPTEAMHRVTAVFQCLPVMKMCLHDLSGPSAQVQEGKWSASWVLLEGLTWDPLQVHCGSRTQVLICGADSQGSPWAPSMLPLPVSQLTLSSQDSRSVSLKCHLLCCYVHSGQSPFWLSWLRSRGCAGTGGPRGAIPRWRSGREAVRRYPLSKVRSNGCTLLEQPWRDSPRPR